MSLKKMKAILLLLTSKLDNDYLDKYRDVFYTLFLYLSKNTNASESDLENVLQREFPEITKDTSDVGGGFTLSQSIIYEVLANKNNPSFKNYFLKPNQEMGKEDVSVDSNNLNQYLTSFEKAMLSLPNSKNLQEQQQKLDSLNQDFLELTAIVKKFSDYNRKQILLSFTTK